MPSQLLIEGRNFGRKSPFLSTSVRYPFRLVKGGGRTTVGELLTSLVLEELSAEQTATRQLITTALDQFNNGKLQTLINGQQQESLNDTIIVKPESKLSFVTGSITSHC